jgi:YD repeat-containing protein
MSAKTNNRHLFTGICILIGLLLSRNAVGQLSLSGATAVAINTSVTYYPLYGGSSTYPYSGSYGYSISGGVVTGTSSTSKGGTNSGILLSMPVSVTWTAASGSLTLYCGLGSTTIYITTFNPLSAGTLSPGSQTINYGTSPSTITGTAATGGAASPSYAYQWQSSPNASSWTNISGATSQNYSPGVLYTPTYYRRQVTETTSSTVGYTSSVFIAIYPEVMASISPVSQTISSGASASTLSSSVTGGNGTYTYQWQSSPNTTSWTNVGTASSYSPGVLSATTFYRLIATSNGVSATSNTATVSVCSSATSVGSITGPATCVVGSAIQLGNSVPGGSWSSSNTGIASVDASGVVTGKAEGSVTITYTLTNSCGTASATKTIAIQSFATYSQSLGRGIPDPIITDTISLVPNTIKTTEYQQDASYSSAHTIQNVLALRVIEETGKYIPGDFTATVVVQVEYGHSSAAINMLDSIKLTVSYTKNAGNKYNALNYFTFNNAEFTRIKVLRVEAPTTVGGVGFDTKQVLQLTNNLAATRYYVLPDNKKPVLSYTNPAAGAVPDALAVSWVFPNHTYNNTVQLEWTWLENELAGAHLDGSGVFDTTILFKNGATRIDLPGGAGAGSYDIPLLYGGVGKLFMRVRGVNLLPSGSRSDGPWSVVQTFAFNGHSDSLNWQVTTTFAEDGKRKSVVQYADGSLRVRQTVTKDNVAQQTIVAETFYDGEGRPAVQVLPAPGISSIIAYNKNLNRFNAQPVNTDPAEYFDFTTPSLGNYGTPALNDSSGAARYYSARNPDVNSGINKHIPAANGFAYAVTRYTPDGTGRIMRQGSVGDSLQIGGNHATKYYYGTPAQEELDALFGTEVGNYTHYFKNMVQDGNGQMSVSYVDMHGRTVATALAGEPPTGMQALNISDTNQYKNQAGKVLTRNLLDRGSNVLKGNSIESVNTVLVPFRTTYSFSYQLAKQTLKLPKCTSSDSIAFDCKFDLQISVTDESGDTNPIVYNYTGIDNINFNQSIILPAGSYSVRKTLTINADSLNRFLKRYDTIGVGICQTRQSLIDSLISIDSTASGCGAAVSVVTSSSCLTSLGTYSTYLSSHASSLGVLPNKLTAAQLADIRSQYLIDSSLCASLNPNISHTLENIRRQMLSDMIPYAGQYARDTGSTTMYGKYNILAPSGKSGWPQPLYRYPRLIYNPSSFDYYYDAYGNKDSSVTSTRLQAMSAADFKEEFKDSWATSLIAYHPEFGKLKFAEDSLRSTFNFIDSIQLVNTAFTVWNADPYFSISSRAAEKNLMKKYSDTTWQGGYSMWQIAYSEAVGCKTKINPATRTTCFSNMPKQQVSAGTVVNDGSGSVTLSVNLQLTAWTMYKTFYRQVRTDMVNRYINVRPGTTDTTDNSTLIAQKFRIYFPYNYAQQAQNLNWTSWFPDAGGNYPTVNVNDSAAQATSVCASYINAWRVALLDCPTLAGKDSATREQILNSITSKMLQVCRNGTDNANPYGSSTVAPAYAGATYTSFEQAINAVLDSAGIPKNTLYCNPYGVEWPKPYGKNPRITQQFVASIDTCTCSQFDKLKTTIVAGGGSISSLTTINQYLWTNFQDTITTALYNGLLNCGQYYLYNCRDTLYNPCPDFHFPTCVWQKCDTLYNLPLAVPQPLPAFLVCGFNSSQLGCFNCTDFKNLATSFYSTFNRNPVFTGTITADSVLAWNDLFARYVNFKTGLQHNWMYYAERFNASSCGVGGLSGSGTGLSICLERKPLNDTTGIVPPVSPCQEVRNQATVKATFIYEYLQQQALASFNAAYLARCLQVNETFAVADTVKEYHYTLYYYDQAGNLVKTVPPKGVRPDYGSTFLNAVKAERVKMEAGQSWTSKLPAHTLVTRYSYNSLNQVVIQKSPDGGVSKFYYDRLGRLVVSQNASQSGQGHVYSYTRYDSLGRITEVGQLTGGSAMSDATARNENNLQSWLGGGASTRNQITQTVYDTAYGPINGVTLSQKNLRNRVSYTQVINLATDAYPASASYYSYDIHGNVDTLLQDYGNSSGVANAMNQSGNRFKKVVYQFDLVSGKVNQVSYQPGQSDAYYHRYVYDGENRLTDVYTGRDSVMLYFFPEREAHYSYYKHGPLARAELGQLRVQGMDYAYTLQGWLKAVNPAMGGTLTNGTDTTEAFPTAQDAYGFSLHYYRGDYKAIGFTPQSTTVIGALSSNAAPLYNGNIAAMAVNIPKLGASKLYNYKYDQLNRIVAMDMYNGLLPASGTFTAVNDTSYKERVSYDPNGNILTYWRNGDVARPVMDRLSYFYTANTNRLHKVTDAAADAGGGTYSQYNDIKQGQTDNNYQYDAIGNLIKDNSEGITNITWTVYGKIASITKSGTVIRYVYDAAGNRIMKQTATDTTVYTRDASGNVLSVYSKAAAGTLQQTENHLYGSSRLGMTTQHTAPDTTVLLATGFGYAKKSLFIRGAKLFELSNHLGNVLATLSDKKIGVDANSDGTVDYYNADVITANDMYSGGMMMPGREYSNSGADYRYSINGQEKEKEINKNVTSAEFGIYDSRIVKRWNLDPRPSVGLSPYAMFGNNPIWRNDPALDTPRVQLGANGLPTGQLGQRFSFTRGAGITDEQFDQMQAAFKANLNQQMNQSGRTFNNGQTNVPVSLDMEDQSAPIINVTFGATGISNASMENSSIYISRADMPNANNTATHEWLHTAGLMDRYIEAWGYNQDRNGNVTINSQRSGTIPMQNLPQGYDNDYNSAQNMMSAAGNQITQQQLSVVFTGINERSLGGLGVVSVVAPNQGLYSLNPRSSFLRETTRALGKMAFSGNQAFLIQAGRYTPIAPTQGLTLFSGSYIIHTQGGSNIYPPSGRVTNIGAALNGIRR